MPATNICTTEVPAITAYRIIGIDGGMMIASDADDDVMAAVNGPGYPFFFIAGISTEPRAATSATAEPEISAKKSDVPTFTIASLPRTKPSSAEAKAIRRREMPEVFMIAPARMNSGMAMSGKFVAPLYMTSGTFGSASQPCAASIATTAAMPSATAIGTLSSTSASTPTRSRPMAI